MTGRDQGTDYDATGWAALLDEEPAAGGAPTRAAAPTEVLPAVEAADEESVEKAETRPDSPESAGAPAGRGRAGGTLAAVGSGLRTIGSAPARLWRAYRSVLVAKPRTVTIAATAAGVVLVLIAGAAVWLWQSAAGAAADREAARATAVSAVPELLSYDPGSVDTLIDRTGDELTGEFKQNYGALISQVVAPAAKSQQITTTAQVTRSSVVPGAQAPDQNQVLLFVNQSTQSPSAAAPAQSGSRVVVTLDRVDGSWLVSDIKPV